MEPSNLLYFFSAAVMLTILPGPDMLFVIAQSISLGKKAGISVALGLCTGLIFHTIAAAFGISIIIYNSDVAFMILKYLGVAYLIFLAFMALKESTINLNINWQINKIHLYRKGILMNLLNPKVLLFFLAFLPQFVDQSDGNVSLQMVSLGIIFIIQAIIIFSIVSILASKISEKLITNKKFAKYLKWIKAGILLFIGISLIFVNK